MILNIFFSALAIVFSYFTLEMLKCVYIYWPLFLRGKIKFLYRHYTDMGLTYNCSKTAQKLCDVRRVTGKHTLKVSTA